MKRYIRTKDGKIYDTTRVENDLFLTENIVHDYVIHNDFLIMIFRKADYYDKYNYGASVLGFVDKQSDNIIDLIEVGDLVEFTYKGERIGIIEIASYDVNSPDNKNVIKIYTKKGNDYILVWDRDKGVI